MGSEDIIFVAFVVFMVLLFLILLVKRLYRKNTFFGFPAMLNAGQLNGHQGQIPTISVAVHLHETHGNTCPARVTDINQSQVDTAPPPFESVVGMSKAEFKVDNLSCNTSHADMECPPPSYEEYLGIVNKAFTNKENFGPEKQ